MTLSCLATFVWLSSITLVFLSCAPRFSFCFLGTVLASAARADARFYFFIVFVVVFSPPTTRGCISLGI